MHETIKVGSSSGHPGFIATMILSRQQTTSGGYLEVTHPLGTVMGTDFDFEISEDVSVIQDKRPTDEKRWLFFQQLAEDYAALQENEEAWREEVEEERLWDGTLSDCLEDE